MYLGGQQARVRGMLYQSNATDSVFFKSEDKNSKYAGLTGEEGWYLEINLTKYHSFTSQAALLSQSVVSANVYYMPTNNK